MINYKLPIAAIGLTVTTLSYSDEIQELDTIQVTSKGLNSNIYNQTTDIQVIDIDSSYSHYSTVSEVINKASGVQVTQRGGVSKDTTIQIDGINLKNSLVLINGQQIGSATLGQASLSNVLVSQVERIEILKGSSSSMYGSSATGGVINIITKQDQNAISLTSGSYGTRKASISLASTNSSISSGLTLSHFKTDGISARIADNSDDDLDGSENTTISGKVDISLNPQLNFHNNFYYAQGSNHYDDPFGGETDQSSIKNAVVGSKLEFYSDNFQIIGGYSQNYDSSINYGGSTSKESAEEYVTRSQKINAYSQYGKENFDLLLGLDWKQDDIGDSKVTGNYAKTSVENKSINSQLSIKQGPILVSIGGRIDDHSSFGKNDTKNASLAFINNENKVLVNYETGFRAPTFNDLYYPSGDFSEGNPDVQPE